MMIMDGTGKGYLAEVDSKNRLRGYVVVEDEATVTETSTIQEKKALSINVKNVLEKTEITEPKKAIKARPKSKFGMTLEK